MKTNSLIGPVELLIFQSTSFCNLDCKYCYLPDRLSKKKINVDIIEKTITNLVDENLLENVINILWHAGEPTVMPIEFYKEVTNIFDRKIPKNIKIRQQIQTNGTLINQNWCDFFKESKMEVGISLDGPKHINDQNRLSRTGKSTFEDTMNGINLLKENNIPFSVISVLTDYSLDFAEEIYNFFKNLDVISLGFNTDEEEGVNLKSTIGHDSIPRLKKFWKKIFELQLKKNNYIEIREIREFNGALLNANITDNPLSFGQMTKPLSILAIDTNGGFSTFSPELLGMENEKYKNFIFGNVLNDSFKSIFENPIFNNVYNDIISGVKKCHDKCPYFSFCGGGAPSNKLYENKTFNSDETNFCLYNKKVIVDSLLEEIELGLKINEHI